MSKFAPSPVPALARADELVAQWDPLARVFGIAGRELVLTLARRAGWGARPVTAPLLPSGLRHGVPWGVSIAMSREQVALRVFLEAQADPPSPDAYLACARGLLEGRADASSVGGVDASRIWHAVAMQRDRAPAFHAYACVPQHPERGWDWLARRGHDAEALRAVLPTKARVTIVSADLASGGRDKLYALVPEARIGELPLLDDAARAFARAMHPADTPIGWLLCFAFRAGEAAPSAVAVHFAAAVHGTPDLATRLAGRVREDGISAFDDACEALGRVPPLHFVAHTSERDATARVTVYLQPEVRR